MIHRPLLLVFALALSSCGHVEEATTAEPSRYSVEKDYYPVTRMDPALIGDAVPREEPLSKYGNKNPYTVLGKTYQLLPSVLGYREEGGASWYGLKFHGHRTSSGETYSTYEMTAAHKTLPIPSFVKVTNLANGRTVVVRVNDRGPFHDDRIIDLSYAAATKLGYVGEGTARVLVEGIDPKTWKREVPEATVALDGGVFLQVGAYSMEKVAQEIHDRLFGKYPFPVAMETGKDQFIRVKIGPVDEVDVPGIIERLVADGFPEPIRLK